LYQYNGKELVEDNGLGWHSYGKRYYDAAIGRFPNVDPLIDTFHFVSGYNYAENEPVAHIDLWGLQKKDMKYNQSALSSLGQSMETAGDIWGKAQTGAYVTLATATAAFPPTVVVAPEVIAGIVVVGQVGSTVEFGGKVLQHVDKELNGTATPLDRASLVIEGVLEFAVPEPVEQALKETGQKKEAVDASASVLLEMIQAAWDKVKE
jgi:RHS repeat-associated protein